jgi:glycosyltransferase involved in cell wall biosynthesis
MKTLFLCHSIEVGGLEMYMLRFARWLAKRHPVHELHVLCKSGKQGSLEAEYSNAGVVLHAMSLGYFNLWPYRELYTLLRSGHYDAVCDFGGDFGALSMLSAYWARIPKRVIFYRCARNAYRPTMTKRLYQRFSNHLVRTFSTQILSNSRAAFDFFFKDLTVMKDDRFKVIRNGIPPPSFLLNGEKEALIQELQIPPDQKIVLHVGSGSWVKNHFCLLDIAERAQNNGDSVCFCFVGAGVENTYGSAARQLNLSNIRFLGERGDVDKLLQVADVFVLPSFTEGQPNALLEAMMSGVPFIASDIAPVREALPPQWENRWLFPPDMPAQGYLLLQEHLTCNFREDVQFKNLVDWSRNVYNEDKCFGEFWTSLNQ